jgi:hypothetical protein
MREQATEVLLTAKAQRWEGYSKAWVKNMSARVVRNAWV